jgi:hypothetical protein
MAEANEFLKISREKVLLTLGIIFVLTPILSVFFFPMPCLATREHGFPDCESKGKITFGIYPFTFAGVMEMWDGCNDSCAAMLSAANHHTYLGGNLYLEFTDYNYTFSKLFGYVIYFDDGRISIDLTGLDLPVDLIVNLMIAYLLSCAVVFAWGRAIKKNEKREGRLRKHV